MIPCHLVLGKNYLQGSKITFVIWHLELPCKKYLIVWRAFVVFLMSSALAVTICILITSLNYCHWLGVIRIEEIYLDFPLMIVIFYIGQYFANKGWKRTSYISLEYLLSLLLVLQGVDGEVRDSDCSWGCESDQQHQVSLSLLQRQLQFVGLFFTQGRQVNLAPRNTHSPSTCDFSHIKQEHMGSLAFKWTKNSSKQKFPPSFRKKSLISLKF